MTGNADSAPSTDAVDVQAQRELSHRLIVETVCGFVVTVTFWRAQVTDTGESVTEPRLMNI